MCELHRQLMYALLYAALGTPSFGNGDYPTMPALLQWAQAFVHRRIHNCCRPANQVAPCRKSTLSVPVPPEDAEEGPVSAPAPYQPKHHARPMQECTDRWQRNREGTISFSLAKPKFSLRDYTPQRYVFFGESQSFFPRKVTFSNPESPRQTGGWHPPGGIRK